MSTHLCFLRIVAPAFVCGLLVACGGKTSLPQGASDAGSGDLDSQVMNTSDGSMCVDIDPATYDDSCTQNTDCTIITVGHLCPGACGCGDTPINVSGLARYQAATASVLTGDCPCAPSAAPVCLENRCTLPTVLPVDASACVDIDPSSYGAVCGSDSDCVLVTTGELCPGECACSPNTAINQTSLQAYEAATASVLTPVP